MEPRRIDAAMRRPAIALAAVVIVGALAGCSSRAPAIAPSPAVRSTAPRSISAIAVLGDSISVGFNACDREGPCKQDSWAGGSDSAVDSVAERLGGSVTVHNLAVPGSRMRNAVQELGELREPVQLVTVLAGANDACRQSTRSMTEPAVFATRVGELLATAHKSAPTARVLMMSIPDLTQLTHDGTGAPAARMCGSIFAEGAAGRAAVRTRIEQFNASIAKACAADHQCVDDGGALFAHRFQADEVSPIDRFHPSAVGQRVIADIAWRALTKAAA